MASKIEAFFKAKGELKRNMRALKAREGMYFTSTIETEMVAFIELVREIGFTRESPEIQFLAIGQLFHDFGNEIPEEKWRESLAHYALLEEDTKVEKSGAIISASPPPLPNPGLAPNAPVPIAPPLTHPPRSSSLIPAPQATSPDLTGLGPDLAKSPSQSPAASTARPSGQKEERSTTAGKSIPLLHNMRLIPVTTTKGVKRGREDDGINEDEIDEGLARGDTNRKRRSTRTATKKSRTAALPSSKDSGQKVMNMGPRPKTALPIVPATRRCERCDTTEEDCWIFVKEEGGRERRACVSCNLLRKGCSFSMVTGTGKSSQPRRRKWSLSQPKVDGNQQYIMRKEGKVQEVADITETNGDQVSKTSWRKKSDEADKVRVVLPAATRNKKGVGKVTARQGSGDLQQPSLAAVEKIKNEEREWHTGWNAVGPSSTHIRRPVESEIAEIYTRLNAVEAKYDNLDEITTVRFQELRQDVNRLDSNAETQKKYVEQKVSVVEHQTESALDRTTGLQEQIDRHRQQACGLQDTMSAMQTHSDGLNKALATMMQRFDSLRFDLPNLLDYWMKMRQDAQSGMTVTGAQLHQGAWEPSQLPSIPSIPPPHLMSSLPPAPEAEAPHPPHVTPPPLPTEPGPSYSEYCIQPMTPYVFERMGVASTPKIRDDQFYLVQKNRVGLDGEVDEPTCMEVEKEIKEEGEKGLAPPIGQVEEMATGD